MLKNQKKIWTEEQIDFLLDFYGQKPMEYLSKKLQKSEVAIILKLQDITGSYSLKEAGGFYTSRQVGPVLGVDPRTILDWIQHRNFPAKRLRRAGKSDARNRLYYIEPIAMWKWVEANKERVPFRHVKRGVMLPEPEWLTAEVRISSKKNVKRPTNWSTEEERKAWNLYSQGLHYREIARMLKRTDSATQRRLTALKKKHLQLQTG